MGVHDDSVRERLGKDAWTILQECGGQIGAQKIKDLATFLNKKVLNQHETRMDLAGTRANLEAEMRDVLSDWWTHELFDM